MRRMRSGLLAVLIAATSIVAACSESDSGEPAPTIGEVDPVEDSGQGASAVPDAELRARAIWSACTEVVCSGAPILVVSSTPEDVRTELAQFTDEIQYVTTSEVEAMAPLGARFPDGATLFKSKPPQPTAKSTVVGVDVWIYSGPGNLVGRTYLFQWDGSQWNQASPDATGVTVTSVIS